MGTTTAKSCIICEARATTSAIGLCERCMAFPVLVEAIHRGSGRSFELGWASRTKLTSRKGLRL